MTIHYMPTRPPRDRTACGLFVTGMLFVSGYSNLEIDVNCDACRLIMATAEANNISFAAARTMLRLK